MLQVTVVGSGVAGLCCAYSFLDAGFSVRVVTASDGPDVQCCSWWAGGMLAPYCEQETAEPLIETLGIESMSFWRSFSARYRVPYVEKGSLVVTASRDRGLLHQFERQTHGAMKLAGEQLESLEPDLRHLQQALWYEKEAHLEPRATVDALWDACLELGANVQMNLKLSEDDISKLAENRQRSGWVVDCRGMGAQSLLPDLRGVKGEMLHLHCPEVELRRPVRFLHPRHPIYLVPRANNVFMLGATMLEVNNSKRASVRSVLELLSAAYAINPAFAEAEIIEIGVDARPAFNDNLPKIRVNNNRLAVNGLYRHGFLAAPALARRVVDYIKNGTQCEQVFDEDLS